MKGDMSAMVGERIKARREELGLSQEQLANLVDYKGGKSTISRIESERVQLNQEKIGVFARALRTTPLYLLGLVDDPSASLGMVKTFKETLNDREKEMIYYYDLLTEKNQIAVLKLIREMI